MSTYVYRRLPCTDMNWFISGQDLNPGLMAKATILEWCPSAEDAQSRIDLMQADTNRFRNLQINQLKVPGF